MNLMMLLDMAVAGHAGRTAFGPVGGGLTYQQLYERASAGAAQVRDVGADQLLFIAPNGLGFPVALFASAWAGVPLVPLNYRLGHDQLQELADSHPSSLIVAEDEVLDLVELGSHQVLSPDAWEMATATMPSELPPHAEDPDAVAVLLYTSGTTATPKAAVLRHRHLSSYVLGTVEFAGTDAQAASLVSVPPYHVAGVSNTVTNVFACRRVVQLAKFDPQAWLDTVRQERITHALVVPTMLARLVDHLDSSRATDAAVPTLSSLAYGGAPMPARIIERALQLFPATDFVNAYGLTETSSTLAVLGPEEHRAAAGSDDPDVRARLGSAGLIVPGIQAEIRGPDGAPLAPGDVGELFVRGEQVSGEYLGRADALDDAGWFGTRDRASIDGDGYLFIEGRADDTIIRGGENIAPAEIEAVLDAHPGVAASAVLGLPDEEWGQVVAAVVVPAPGAEIDVDDLGAWARSRLRTSKTPARFVVRSELPYTETGKLLRRELVAELSPPHAIGDPSKETLR